jgi:hypothetical protein
VHFDHLLRGVARLLVQLVDVLRDQRMQLSSSFQVHQRQVPRVGLCAPRRARHPIPPGKLPHLAVREVVVDVGHLLGERIPGPQALRAAEIRDSRVGGDSRAGKRHDAPGGIDPGTSFFDQGI